MCHSHLSIASSIILFIFWCSRAAARPRAPGPRATSHPRAHTAQSRGNQNHTHSYTHFLSQPTGFSGSQIRDLRIETRISSPVSAVRTQTDRRSGRCQRTAGCSHVRTSTGATAHARTHLRRRTHTHRRQTAFCAVSIMVVVSDHHTHPRAPCDGHGPRPSYHTRKQVCWS